MHPTALWLLLVAAGYLAGSIPFAILIARRHGVDIRKAGSGNAGATNVLRVLGKGPGALCFALDAIKGFAPTLAGGFALGAIGAEDLPASAAWRWLAVMAAPVVGHVFPVFAGFKGGKGVATGFGTALGVWPWMGAPALAALALWVLVQRTTRNVGLASSVAAILLPALVTIALLVNRSTEATAAETLERGLPFLVVSTLLATLVLWRHRTNLAKTFGWDGGPGGAPPAMGEPAQADDARGPQVRSDDPTRP